MIRVTCLVASCSLVLTGCDALRSPNPDVRYVAFGDSATDGSADRDYPTILRELLDESIQAFAIEANGGETTDEGLGRLSSLIQLGLFPDATTLLYWEGGADIVDFINDADPFLLFSPADSNYPFDGSLSDRLDLIQSNIESAIQTGTNAGLAVYVATYFPIQENAVICDAVPLDLLLPGQAERANDYVALLNERIERAAMAAGAVLVDVAARSETFTSDTANYINCNHLSDQGNEIVADVFLSAIQAQQN